MDITHYDIFYQDYLENNSSYLIGIIPDIPDIHKNFIEQSKIVDNKINNNNIFYNNTDYINSIEDNENSIEDDVNSIEEDENSIEESENSMEDDENSILVNKTINKNNKLRLTFKSINKLYNKIPIENNYLYICDEHIKSINKIKNFIPNIFIYTCLNNKLEDKKKLQYKIILRTNSEIFEIVKSKFTFLINENIVSFLDKKLLCSISYNKKIEYNILKQFFSINLDWFKYFIIYKNDFIKIDINNIMVINSKLIKILYKYILNIEQSNFLDILKMNGFYKLENYRKKIIDCSSIEQYSIINNFIYIIV